MSFRKYYEEYGEKMPFEKGITLGTKKRFSFVLKHMKEPVLDVGCSHGYDLKNLYAVGLRNLSGIDISEKVIKKARETNGIFAEFSVHDITNAPMGKKFSTIYSFDVIEHVFETNDFVKNIYASLKNNGRFIVATPNALGLANRVKFLFGKGDYFIPKEDNPHIRFFTLPIIIEKLKQHGFRGFEIFSDSRIPFLPANLCGSITVVAFRKKSQ